MKSSSDGSSMVPTEVREIGSGVPRAESTRRRSRRRGTRLRRRARRKRGLRAGEPAGTRAGRKRRRRPGGRGVPKRRRRRGRGGARVAVHGPDAVRGPARRGDASRAWGRRTARRRRCGHLARRRDAVRRRRRRVSADPLPRGRARESCREEPAADVAGVGRRRTAAARGGPSARAQKGRRRGAGLLGLLGLLGRGAEARIARPRVGGREPRQGLVSILLRLKPPSERLVRERRRDTALLRLQPSGEFLVAHRLDRDGGGGGGTGTGARTEIGSVTSRRRRRLEFLLLLLALLRLLGETLRARGGGRGGTLAVRGRHPELRAPLRARPPLRLFAHPARARAVPLFPGSRAVRALRGAYRPSPPAAVYRSWRTRTRRCAAPTRRPFRPSPRAPREP